MFPCDFLCRIYKCFAVILKPKQPPATGSEKGLEESPVTVMPRTHHNKVAKNYQHTTRNYKRQPLFEKILFFLILCESFPHNSQACQPQPKQAITPCQSHQARDEAKSQRN